MNKAAMGRFLKEFPNSLNEGTGSIFIGAGVSMAAGYPSWSELLREIGEELGVSSTNVHDLAALAQWSIHANGGATRVREVIKKEIGPNKAIPVTVEIIARLPVQHIWTTNYDRLIERAFQDISRPIEPISGADNLALKTIPGAVRLYKMHGSVDRVDDIVISTDDYELFRSKRGAYLPLFQAHLTSMSMLFIGISFTDPNIKHVLSLIRESFKDAPPEHFAIVRPPKRDDYSSEDEYIARLTQHKLWAKDLKRYGLLVVEIENYDEVPDLLHKIERRVAAKRVWISGSWPIEHGGIETFNIHALAESIGQRIGEINRDLVTGAGVLVGSASISGFLAALRNGGGWDLDRRLVARPFPQPLQGEAPDENEWSLLRNELARQAGIVIFVGGAKLENGSIVCANGVFKEFEYAKNNGAFLIPIAATGGAAKVIGDQLMGSNLATAGTEAQRPNDQELSVLSDVSLLSNQEGRKLLVKNIFEIIERIAKTS